MCLRETVNVAFDVDVDVDVDSFYVSLVNKEFQPETFMVSVKIIHLTNTNSTLHLQFNK